MLAIAARGGGRPPAAEGRAAHAPGAAAGRGGGGQAADRPLPVRGPPDVRVAAMLEAVLFDYGDTLLEFTFDEDALARLPARHARRRGRSAGPSGRPAGRPAAPVRRALRPTRTTTPSSSTPRSWPRRLRRAARSPGPGARAGRDRGGAPRVGERAPPASGGALAARRGAGARPSNRHRVEHVRPARPAPRGPGIRRRRGAGRRHRLLVGAGRAKAGAADLPGGARRRLVSSRQTRSSWATGCARTSQGPAALGMRTCLVTYFRVDHGDHGLADSVATSPAEVLAAVDRIMAAGAPGKL